jgi:general secretion pathway protein J
VSRNAAPSSRRARHRGPRRACARGFTLFELLVALFIAALMFAMGYGAIRQAITNHAVLKERQLRLLQLQTAMRILEQDFVQLAPRPVRQPIGDEPSQPALQSGLSQTETDTLSTTLSATPSATQGGTQSGTESGTPPLVSLTRGGWANPRGLQRGELQRVAYFFENNTLRRESWYVLDPTLSSTTARRELLTHVKSVTFQYMDMSHTWQTQWPPLTVAGAQALESTLRIRPIAVQVTIDTDDFGKISRIFEVAG